MNHIGRISCAAAALFCVWSSASRAAEAADEASSQVIMAPRDLADVRLAGDPSLAEQAGSVAVNPTAPNRLVVAIRWSGQGFYENACAARSSADGGRTWTTPVTLPVPAGYAGCRSPSLGYSAEGDVVHAAYTTDVVVTEPYVFPGSALLASRSRDGGVTWERPTIVLTTENNRSINWNRLATPPRKSDRDRRNVYVVFDRHQSNFPGSAGSTGELMFVRSLDDGRTWSEPQILERSASATFGENFGFRGGSVAAGEAGDVLVAWAWFYTYDLSVNQIRVARSDNFGQSFATPVVVVDDSVDLSSAEVKIGAASVAHIVYKRLSPVSELRYVHSYNRRPPYQTWAPAVTLDALGATSFGNSSLAIEPCGTTSSILHVAWIKAQGNLQNVYYARKLARSGSGWSSRIRVSNFAAPSMGAEMDLAAGAGRSFAIWTDARHNPPQYAPDASNVYGSRILSGVTCAADISLR